MWQHAQCDIKGRHIKFRHRWITQKKTYNIQTNIQGIPKREWNIANLKKTIPFILLLIKKKSYITIPAEVDRHCRVSGKLELSIDFNMNDDLCTYSALESQQIADPLEHIGEASSFTHIHRELCHHITWNCITLFLYSEQKKKEFCSTKQWTAVIPTYLTYIINHFKAYRSGDAPPV